MKKHTLGLAVAGVMLMAVADMPHAYAAGAGPVQLNAAGSAFAPSEGGFRFVVKYRDATPELRDATQLNRGLSQAALRAGIGHAIADSARSSARPAANATLMRRMGVSGWSVIKASRHLDAQEAANFMRELRANPSVESVELDRIRMRIGAVGPTMIPNDPDYASRQWNLSDPVSGVRAPAAWERSTGEGVVVAVLDTGILEGLSDLQNNVIPGYDMITDARVSRRAADGRVPGGWDEGDWTEANYCTGWATEKKHSARDSSWHGSHVSGTIAQETNNGIGVAGLAHNAKVMPIRVLGSCGGFDSDIADGVIWAVGGDVPGMPRNENPAEVLNMSLGSSGPNACPLIYQDALDYAVNSKGAVVVVAAGNGNAVAGNYTMSSCNNVISVGATERSGARAVYSNYGPRVDLAAPGGDRWGFDPIYQMVSSSTTTPSAGSPTVGGIVGTSMASPHVAAAAAMVQSVAKTPLDWMQMRHLLKGTVTPFPLAIPVGKPIGAGILNVDAALAKATEESCDPSAATCAPVATPLTNKEAATGLVGGRGKEKLYSFEAKAGQVLTVMTYGGWGDVSLYVSLDAAPTATKFDAKSTRVGNSETVRFTAPKAGTYYVNLVGVAAYGRVTLVARQ